MPLSIGAVASHFTTDSFNVYDYPANLLTYTPVAPTWGATSGSYGSSTGVPVERARFDIEAGHWYTITVASTAISQSNDKEWSLGTYIGFFDPVFGLPAGNLTCDFGACPSPGPTMNELGTYYFFAPYSTADCSFYLRTTDGTSQARGLWRVSLSKSSTQWTELTSVSGIAINSTRKQLLEFQTTDTMNPFLVCNKTAPFDVNTVTGLTVTAALNMEPLIILPRLPAVFGYSEQLSSGTWRLSGSATSSRTLDVFVYTEVPNIALTP